MTTPLIELDGLTQAYGSHVALRGLTGTVPATSVGLVGENGAGKSTLMKVLLGILKPTGGSARVLGLSVTEQTIAQRMRAMRTGRSTLLIASSPALLGCCDRVVDLRAAR